MTLLTVSFLFESLPDTTPVLFCAALWSRMRETIRASCFPGSWTYMINIKEFQKYIDEKLNYYCKTKEILHFLKPGFSFILYNIYYL